MEVLEPIEKAAKKTYQKHKTEKKIGVSCYLNTNLLGVDFGGETFYPLYFRISYNGTFIRVKSEYLNVFTEKDFDNRTDTSNEGISYVTQICNYETQKRQWGYRKIINAIPTLTNLNKIDELYKFLFFGSVGSLINEYLIYKIYTNTKIEKDFDVEYIFDGGLGREGKNRVNFSSSFHQIKSAFILKELIKNRYETQLSEIELLYNSKIWILDALFDLLPPGDSTIHTYACPAGGFFYSLFDFHNNDFNSMETLTKLNVLTSVEVIEIKKNLQLILNDIFKLNLLDFNEFVKNRRNHQ